MFKKDNLKIGLTAKSHESAWVTRKVALCLTLPVLVALLCLLRSYRFERDPNENVITGKDLSVQIATLPSVAAWEWKNGNANLAIRKQNAPAYVSLAIPLKVNAPVKALHFTYSIRAIDLQLGKNEWDDGRILIQWISKDGKTELLPISSVRHNEKIDRFSVVSAPKSGVGYPILMIEHLGSSGDFIVSDLEISPIFTKSFAPWLDGLAFFCAAAWIYHFLSHLSRSHYLRRIFTALIWVIFASVFAYPGPWRLLTPYFTPFHFGEKVEVVQVPKEQKSPPTNLTENKQTVKKNDSLGRVTINGSWVISLRYALKNQRVLIHILFAAGVAGIFTLLVDFYFGSLLASALILMIEFCQLGFGYGLDRTDAMDISLGIVCILLTSKMISKVTRWKPFSKWMLVPSS